MRTVSTAIVKPPPPLPSVKANSRLRKIQVGTPAPNNIVPGIQLLFLLSALTHKLQKVRIDLRKALQRRKCLVHHLFPSHTLYKFRSEAGQGGGEGESIELVRSFGEVEDEGLLEL